MNTIKRISSHNMAGGNYWHLFQHPDCEDQVIIMHDEYIWTQDKNEATAYVAGDLEELPQSPCSVAFEYIQDDDGEIIGNDAHLHGLYFEIEGDFVTVTYGQTETLTFDYNVEG